MLVKQISVVEAKALLKSDSAILVDIRDIVNYTVNNIPQAIHLSQDTLESFLAHTSKSITVLVICYHGVSSIQVAQFLMNEGFENVYSISGGYEEWIEKDEIKL